MELVLTCDQDKYIFPLLDTTFEGVPAKVPYRYQQMLESEYGKAAVLKTDYNGYASRYSVCASLGLTGIRYRFDTQRMQWFPMNRGKVYDGKA